MKKKNRNTASFVFLLLIAACFLTHNDVYKQNINRKRLKICPKTYKCKKWSASITYYPNYDACYNLLISGDIELNPGPKSGNRVGNQGNANVRASKCNICYKNLKIARLWSYHACTLRELPLYHKDVLSMKKKLTTTSIHMSQNFKNSKHTSVYVILIHSQ